MRLLHVDGDGDLRVVEHLGTSLPRYAILSHTWGSEEVTFQDLMNDRAKSKAGYRKLCNSRDQAAADDLKHLWVDTCCIDKSSSAELSEAINSMFRWYQKSEKCYVYLSDVSYPSDETERWTREFKQSRWFTRGWTLQELLAPTSVEFFSREWVHLGSKKSLEQIIHETTGIPIDALRGIPLARFSAGEKFMWAEGRSTMREEDAAYCLMGMFDIQMPLLYGEGREKARKRLEREVKEALGDIAPPMSEPQKRTALNSLRWYTPQMAATNAQQTANRSDSVESQNGATQQSRRICGSSPKKFWILITVIVLIIICAAVGGGIGATISNRSSTAKTNSTQTRNAILPNSRLATFNFTENEVEYSSVVFQSSDASLYQTLWDSSTNSWTVTPVITDASEVQIKPNTPLAASVRLEASGSTFFLFFLDTLNRLRSYTSSSISGPWTADTTTGKDKQNNVPPDSPLLTYSNADSNYVYYQFIAWQDDVDGTLQLRCMSYTCGGQSQTELAAAFPSMQINSSLAIAPLYALTDVNDPQLAVYGYNSGLWEAHYTLQPDGQWDWVQQRSTLGVQSSKMNETASLAAFSTGWFLTPDNRTAPAHVQVLWTQPGSKGVSLIANKNEYWLDIKSNVAPFQHVAGYSAIAANQAGRVYAVEEVEGSKGVQLVEWQFVEDSADYARIGIVDTDVPQKEEQKV